jgi:8-oxo-dGTP diphosphatase
MTNDQSTRGRRAELAAPYWKKEVSSMTSSERSPVKVVAGLIYRDGKLLACQRRADGAFPLKWEFPGGKVEEGEDDIAALTRELREELAIEVRHADLIWQHQHSYPDGPRVSLRFYQLSEFGGEPQNLVFEKISWLDLADLDAVDFLAGDRPLITQLLSHGIDLSAR